MEALIEEGAFLEHAVFGGNMYGTSRASVAKVANQGKICILDIDMQGVKLIKQSGLKARSALVIGEKTSDQTISCLQVCVH